MRRPINPVIPYPHEAIQHTRCVLALSMITVALSLLKPEMLPQLGDLGKQVEKVDRWIERCSDGAQRRLSSGAKRRGRQEIPYTGGTCRFTGGFYTHALASSQRRAAVALSACTNWVQNGAENDT